MTLWNRRQVLAAALATAALPACRSRGSAGTTTTTTIFRGFVRADLDVAPLAAGLEQLAVDVYRGIGVAAGEGIGRVPDAGAEVLKTVLDHHQAHLDRWNEILRGGGRGAVETPEPRLQPRFEGMVADAETFSEALEAALQLEQILAATYLEAVASMESRPARNLIGSVHVVEMEHAAVLRQITGGFPVPDAFATRDGALRP